MRLSVFVIGVLLGFISFAQEEEPKDLKDLREKYLKAVRRYEGKYDEDTADLEKQIKALQSKIEQAKKKKDEQLNQLTQKYVDILEKEMNGRTLNDGALAFKKEYEKFSKLVRTDTPLKVAGEMPEEADGEEDSRLPVVSEVKEMEKGKWIGPIGGKLAMKGEEVILRGPGNGASDEALVYLNKDRVNKISGMILFHGSYSGFAVIYDRESGHHHTI